ncbi:hypothetical protein ABZ547_18610 [Streptomyces sparsogenes]|uniref:hypothetical protein n=1 Tax=Streptomyces sparsogenes TaxID=67365 RepID=UPI0033DF577D
MTARRSRLAGDAGQAFPIYITAVAALLFLALALFAVGQAGATRNGGQTAADAAALGAAEDFRDQVRKGLLDAIADGASWEDLLTGRGFDPPHDPCDQAQWFAGENDADVVSGGCVPGYLPVSFTVTVKTRKAVGKSVIPGTETKHATAKAKAVVEPRCVLDEPAPLPDPTGDGKGDGGGDGGKDGDGKDGGGKDGGGKGDDGKDDGGKDEKPVIDLVCEGENITIDPERLDLFPDAKDLFSVHLAD